MFTYRNYRIEAVAFLLRDFEIESKFISVAFAHSHDSVSIYIHCFFPHTRAPNSSMYLSFVYVVHTDNRMAHGQYRVRWNFSCIVFVCMLLSDVIALSMPVILIFFLAITSFSLADIRRENIRFFSFIATVQCWLSSTSISVRSNSHLENAKKEYIYDETHSTCSELASRPTEKCSHLRTHCWRNNNTFQFTLFYANIKRRRRSRFAFCWIFHCVFVSIAMWYREGQRIISHVFRISILLQIIFFIIVLTN